MFVCEFFQPHRTFLGYKLPHFAMHQMYFLEIRIFMTLEILVANSTQHTV